MSIDRVLQFHTAVLALLGSIFVSVGHRSTALPAALAIAAVTSVFVTDVLKWLRLNRVTANLMAIAAVVWSLRHFFELTPEEQLMAIANMLCYLQIVLL